MCPAPLAFPATEIARECRQIQSSSNPFVPSALQTHGERTLTIYLRHRKSPFHSIFQIDRDFRADTNYEFGWKSTWLGGRARTTLAVYYGRWLNGQVGNSIPIVAEGVANLINIVLNNGEAELKGIELEGQWQATEKLTLSGSYGLNDTEAKAYVCVDCNNSYGSFEGVVGNTLHQLDVGDVHRAGLGPGDYLAGTGSAKFDFFETNYIGRFAAAVEPKPACPHRRRISQIVRIVLR